MSIIYKFFIPYVFPYWLPIPYNMHEPYATPYSVNAQAYNRYNRRGFRRIKDYGPEPFVVNIDEATMDNNTFRSTLWTGENLQVSLMSINVGEDIGLEIHPTVDQFIRVEQGEALVEIGDRKDMLSFQEEVYDDYAIMIPAGKWHNVTNIGNSPLKVYTIYAPPEHPRDTIHRTKADAEAAEENHGHY